MALVRLDKLLTESGMASRSEARKFIRDGRVAVNGLVCRQPEAKVEAAAELTLDGESIGAGALCLMLHKPAGVLSATEDAEQKTVLDLLPARLRNRGYFPVGRLDKDTTGLLLLTTDGDLAHRIISPKKQVEKQYIARVDGVLTEEDVRAFAEGLVLGDGTACLPAGLELLDGGRTARVTLTEGKYHQVKRMLASRGAPVLTLHRERIGALRLDINLAPGEFRPLDKEEIDLLFVLKN